MINFNLEDQAFALFDLYFPDVMYGEKKIGDSLTPSRGRTYCPRMQFREKYL